MSTPKPDAAPAVGSDAPADTADLVPTPADQTPAEQSVVPESGGRGGLDPTRYGDWEVGGICTDF